MSFIPPTQNFCTYCQLPAERPIGPEPDKRKGGKCPECSSPHHVWCWHVHGGCAKPNCVCNPANRKHGAIPYEPARVHELYMMEQGPENAQANPDRWSAFEKFEQEYATGSHRRIAAAWNQELFNHFQPADKYRAEVVTANVCAHNLERLVAEYRRGRWQEVVAIYQDQQAHFDTCSDFLNGYKQHVDEARKQVALELKRQIALALAQNDDAALEKILSEGPAGALPTARLDYLTKIQLLTAEEQKWGAQALERLYTIRRIESYLARKDTQDEALALFNDRAEALRLEDSKALSRTVRAELYEVRRAFTRDALREAVIRGDDDEILSAANAALAVGWTLPDATQDRVRQAGERKAARARLASAKNEGERWIALDDELVDAGQMSDGGREGLASSKRLYKPLLGIKRAVRRNDYRALASLLREVPEAAELRPHLDDAENAVVADVQVAAETLKKLQELLEVQPRTESVVKQIVALCGKQVSMQTLNALMSAYEREQVRLALLTHAAVDELERLVQAPDMAFIKLAIAKTFDKAREAGVVLPSTLNWGKIRAAVNFDEQWSALVRAIEAGDERAIFAAWNPNLLYEGLELLGAQDKATLLSALQKTSRDARLMSALASNDAERVAFARRELSEYVNRSDPKSV